VQTSVLVIDDDPRFRETLSDAMELKSISVDGAGSAGQALQRLGAHRPSLILLDVQLPDVHGFELCRALKSDERFADIPVVLLSARFTEPADRAEGLMAGAEAYLSKSIGMESLWEEVRYLLDTGG